MMDNPLFFLRSLGGQAHLPSGGVDERAAGPIGAISDESEGFGEKLALAKQAMDKTTSDSAGDKQASAQSARISDTPTDADPSSLSDTEPLTGLPLTGVSENRPLPELLRDLTQLTGQLTEQLQALGEEQASSKASLSQWVADIEGMLDQMGSLLSEVKDAHSGQLDTDGLEGIYQPLLQAHALLMQTVETRSSELFHLLSDEAGVTLSALMESDGDGLIQQSVGSNEVRSLQTTSNTRSEVLEQKKPELSTNAKQPSLEQQGDLSIVDPLSANDADPEVSTTLSPDQRSLSQSDASTEASLVKPISAHPSIGQNASTPTVSADGVAQDQSSETVLDPAQTRARVGQSEGQSANTMSLSPNGLSLRDEPSSDATKGAPQPVVSREQKDQGIERLANRTELAMADGESAQDLLMNTDADENSSTFDQRSGQPFAAALKAESQEGSDKPAPFLTKINTHFSKPEWSASLQQRVVWLSNQQISSAQIIMEPPELGPIEIQLKQKREGAQVLFVTHTAAVKEVLENALPRLREMFDAQGLQLADANVRDQGEQQAFRQSENANERGGFGSAEGEEAPESSESKRESVTLSSENLVDYYV